MWILPQFLRKLPLIGKIWLLNIFPIVVASMYVFCLFFFFNLKLFDTYFSIYTVFIIFILVAVYILVIYIHHSLIISHIFGVFLSFFLVLKNPFLCLNKYKCLKLFIDITLTFLFQNRNWVTFLFFLYYLNCLLSGCSIGKIC